MKKILFIFAILAVPLFWYSCQKENVINKLEDQTLEEYNKNIVDSYKVELDQLNCLKSQDLNLTEILKTDEGKAIFLEYFGDFKIEIKGIEYTINDYDPLLVEKMYESTIVKLSHFNDFSLESIKTAPTNKEIRDALLKECGTYEEPIGVICKSAVWIAYWVR